MGTALRRGCGHTPHAKPFWLHRGWLLRCVVEDIGLGAMFDPNLALEYQQINDLRMTF